MIRLRRAARSEGFAEHPFGQVRQRAVFDDTNGVLDGIVDAFELDALVVDDCVGGARVAVDNTVDALATRYGLRDDQAIDPVVALLHGQRLRIRRLLEKRWTLEDVFIETVEAAEPGVDAHQKRNGGKP